MFVEVTASGVHVREPFVFDKFDVRAPKGVDDAAIDAALGAAGLGSLRDGQAFIEVAELTRLCPQNDPAWSADFAAMFRYADTQGWTGDDGRVLLAHVERQS